VKAKVHRTWPCGMQESVETRTNPLWEFAKVNDDDKRHPCPLHGLDCHGRREGYRETLRAV
jgi:hypothetical protein